MSHRLFLFWGRRGGIPRFMLELALSLKNNTDCLSVSKQSDLIEAYRGLGQNHHEISTFTSFFSGILSVFRLPYEGIKIYAYLKKNKITHAIALSNHVFLPFFIPLFKMMGIRLSLIVHDAYAHLGEKKWIDEVLLRIGLHFADRIITLSESVTKGIVARKVDPLRIQTLFHPCFYANSNHRPRDHVSRILFIGRIFPYKGLDLLADAFAQIKNDYPEISLSIYGEGDILPCTEKKFRDQDVRIMNTWIPDDEFPKIIEAHDLVVLPYIEASQSGVIAASLGLGVPVVITPVGGLSEQISHNESGWIARSVDVNGLVEALQIPIQDHDRYLSCLKTIRQFNRSWADFLEKIDSLNPKSNDSLER